ncbi:6-hydroxymethylpterin diphosphokinase MptE-like protein [Dasania marina]|uniref:motility associated factor glycosyltransferase family protein n=1 Tax=Dasania marina TaxID=471499 RepID=UPI0030DC893D|tara:strand:- start:16301 stop:17602 length:1302 start_codon:yes stop_codon:yes gene_type:complete
MNMLSENLAVIENRWPTLLALLNESGGTQLNANVIQGQEQTLAIEQVQLCSRHNREAEAQLQAQAVPENASHVYLYGTGMGDVQRVLLARPELKQLHVYILSEAVFKLLILHTDQRFWLTNPRVQLHFADTSARIYRPFIALPADMQLASDRYISLANRVGADLQQYWLERKTIDDESVVQARFQQNTPLLQQDGDVRELIAEYRGCYTRAIIVGAGPSLERHIAQLQSLLQEELPPLVIAVDTAMRALHGAGIIPDIVCCIDRYIHEDHLAIASSQQCHLVYFPMVQNSLLTAWQGTRYAAYGDIPLYYDLCALYPKGRLYLGGSVIHPTIDLAQQMAVQELVLFGCDFCFIDNKTHSYWGDEELGIHTQQAMSSCYLLNGHGERVQSVPNLASYLSSLELYLEAHKHLKVYNSSRLGAAIAGTSYLDEVSL